MAGEFEAGHARMIARIDLILAEIGRQVRTPGLLNPRWSELDASCSRLESAIEDLCRFNEAWGRATTGVA